MHLPTRSYLTGQMILLLLAGLLLGLLFGHPVTGVLLVVLVYLIWSHRQLLRLLDWLELAAEKELETSGKPGYLGRYF